jgi:hypothetical protein
MAKTAEVIIIPAIKIEELAITLIGDSPLIVHRFSEKVKREMLDKQMKKATTKAREAKNPVADFMESLYWLTLKPGEHTEEAFEAAINDGAEFGFPSIAFKSSAVSAAYRAGITKDKATSRGAFHIDGEFVKIDGIPSMREDMVRIQGTSADIRYRGEFKEWKTTFKVRYNASVYSVEQIANFFNLGGFACGVGEWRPEKDGSYGMFHVGN